MRMGSPSSARHSPSLGRLRHVHATAVHVRMEVRILRAARPVLVGGRDESRCAFAEEAAGAATDDAGLVLEVRERGLPGRDMRLVDGAARCSSSPSACRRLTLFGGEKTRS